MRRKRHLQEDLLLVLASLAVAYAIVHFNFVELLLAQAVGKGMLTAFVAGMFFTSLVTTAPAIVVLGELAFEVNPFLLALVGGLGAVIGDYVIFAFVRDRVSSDVAYLIEHSKTPRFFKLFRRRTFRRFLPFLGGLIIASPLPDELGLTLLGLNKTKTLSFVIISYLCNAGGILLIALAAHALAS